MSPAEELPRIHQIVALRDPDRSLELGPALWAALSEIEAFCNQPRERARFRRTYVSEVIPERLQSPSPLSPRRWINALFGSGPEENDDTRILATDEGDSTLSMARGRYHRTYNGERLAQILRRQQADEDIEADFTLMITDRELADSSLRYVLWWYDEKEDLAAVVSTVAMDPAYWRTHDDHRAATVKQRVRAACLWNVLRFLGVEVCDNETCYLFGEIGAFTDLDRMTHLGPEHQEAAEWVGQGFEPTDRRPYEVQSLLTGRAPEGSPSDG